MTIESNQGAGLGRSTVAHPTGKSGGGVAVGSWVGASDFSGVMGSLFAAEDPVVAGNDDAAIQIATADAGNLVTSLMGQTQGGFVVPLIGSAQVGVSVEVENVGQAVGVAGTTRVVGNGMASSGHVGKAMLPVGAALKPSEQVDGLTGGNISKVSAAISLKEGSTQIEVPVSGAPTPSGAQSVSASNDMALAAGTHLASLVRRDTSIAQTQESVSTSPTMVSFVSVGVPQVDAFLHAGKGKAENSNGDGLGLGVGMHQVLDRLGLSAGQGVTQTSVVVADTQVAETVSYWVTQGIQNAELTLDGLGDEPVGVHIELDGNQTRVDFRTDQPQVRQALEAASAQLKILLLSQGLELTGVSVGAFAQGGQPSDSRGTKPPFTRSVELRLVDHVSAAPSGGVGTAVGQSLDLYV